MTQLAADHPTLYQVYVAESPEDGVAIGVCALERHDNRWELAQVWVAPASRHRGVGRALVEQALAAARAEDPELAIRVQANPNAIGFYEQLGAALISDAPDRDLPVLEFRAWRAR